MDLLSVVKAPCVPFSTRPRTSLGRTTRSRRVVHCEANSRPEERKQNGITQELLKACAPFAAAVLLLAQANPAAAESQFQASIRRQAEFFSGKSGGSSKLDSFLQKGADSVADSAKDVASSGPSLPFGKSDAGGAVESAKSAASDAASGAQSVAKAAAPDDATQGGKEAASNIVDGAKSVVQSSQKEAEVAGTGSAEPSGRGLTSKAADAAKSAASDAKDAVQSPVSNPVDTAVDTAKSAAGDAQSTASSATSGNPIDSAVGSVKSVADDAKSGASITPVSNPVDEAQDAAKSIVEEAKKDAPTPREGSPTVGNPLDAAKDAAKSTTNVAQAPDAPTKNFFSNFLGIEGKQPGPAPPSQLEEKVPKGAAPLPEQPQPEPESKQLGNDNAGGKIQDTARGSGPLDLFGGGKTGQSPQDKAAGLVQEAQKPNSFLGGLFGIDDAGKGPTSSLPTKNELGQIADGQQLEAPQPSELEEAGNLPESSPGSENKLPEQPAPEPTAPEDLGKDSAGGKTGSTKSGGGILDFFGGSSSQPSQPATSTDPVSYQTNNNSNPVSLVADASDKLRGPQPSDVNEGGIMPERAAGEGNQPDPGAGSGADKDVGRDREKETGNLFDFFGRATPQSALPGNSQQLPVSMTYNNSDLLTFVKEKVAAPQPSELEESYPESAPGQELAPEEQPYPEPASKQLPQDNSGGETQDTKRGGGALDFFGGSGTGDSQSAAASNVEKAKSTDNTLTPESAKIGLQLQGDSSNPVAETAEVEAPEDAGKVTAIGLGLSLALAILIFTVQPQAEATHH